MLHLILTIARLVAIAITILHIFIFIVDFNDSPHFLVFTLYQARHKKFIDISLSYPHHTSWMQVIYCLVPTMSPQMQAL